MAATAFSIRCVLRRNRARPISTIPARSWSGVGADFDLTPEFRLSTNANHLWFENTATLQALRNEGSIPKDIGWDLSAPRRSGGPRPTQNIVFRLSGAALLSGKGFRRSVRQSRQGRDILFRARKCDLDLLMRHCPPSFLALLGRTGLCRAGACWLPARPRWRHGGEKPVKRDYTPVLSLRPRPRSRRWKK